MRSVHMTADDLKFSTNQADGYMLRAITHKKAQKEPPTHISIMCNRETKQKQCCHSL